MNKLLFDLLATQPSCSSKRHGGGKYGEIIFFRMVNRGFKFSCFYDSRLWLNPEVKDACEHYHIPLYDTNKDNLRDIILKNGITCLYSCLLGDKVQYVPENVRIVCTWHGLRGLETPVDTIFYKYHHSLKEHVKFLLNRFAHRFWMARTMRKYRREMLSRPMDIITVSEHSYYAIRSWFPEYKGDLKTFFSPNTSYGELKCRRYDGVRYFLMVSGNRWEKNNLRAIIAFDRLVTKGLVPEDVCVKITGRSADMFKYKIQNPDRFDFMGYVDEDKLEELYANAWCFVYPTLNEGFGYPPMEAMRYHVPVIGSPLSSIAELYEGGILYFNPFQVEEIMNRMLIMLDEKRHDHFVEQGYQKYLEIKERQDHDLDALIDYVMHAPE